MNRDWPEDEQRYNRLDTDLAEKDPADRDENRENDSERRDRLTSIIESVEPQPKTGVEPDVVYGDTDLNPNADDQRDAHEAGPDDIA